MGGGGGTFPLNALVHSTVPWMGWCFEFGWRRDEVEAGAGGGVEGFWGEWGCGCFMRLFPRTASNSTVR